MWFYFAVASAVFLSLRRLAEKPLAGKLSYYTLGWATQLFSLPIITLLFIISDRNVSISSPYVFFLPLIIIWVILYPIQSYCYYRSLHEGTLSEVIPVLSFIPVFTMLISAISVREIPSQLGLLGIGSTVAGVFLLHTKSFKTIHHIIKNRSAMLMLISSLSIAVGTTLDKIALSTVTNPGFYTLINVLGATVSLFFVATFVKRDSYVGIRQYMKPLVLVGIAQSIFYSLYTIAVQQGITSYVVALRNFNVLVSACLGIIFFHESLTFKKGFSYAFIGLGLIILAYA